MLAAYAWIEDGIDGRLENSEEPCYQFSFFPNFSSYWWCDSTLGEKYTDVGSAKNSQVFSRFSKLLIITNFFRNTMMIWQKIMRLLSEPGATIVQR